MRKRAKVAGLAVHCRFGPGQLWQPDAIEGGGAGAEGGSPGGGVRWAGLRVCWPCWRARSCSTLSSVKETFLGGSSATAEPERLTGFIGAALADEPRAALAGRDVLALGGTAADAAVAMGFMSWSRSRRAPVWAAAARAWPTTRAATDPAPATPRPSSSRRFRRQPRSPHRPPGRDPDAAARAVRIARALRQAAVRDSLITPAEQAARFGVPVSRALVQDLAVVAGPLAQDPNARAVFAPGGAPLAEGSTLSQPDLGATLAQLRTAGVGDLYVGALARRVADASRVAGGGLVAEEMRRRAAAHRRAADAAGGSGLRRVPAAARRWRLGRGGRVPGAAVRRRRVGGAGPGDGRGGALEAGRG